jgi:hypothetical protein
MNVFGERCLQTRKIIVVLSLLLRRKTMDPIFDLAMIVVVGIMVAFNIHG